MKNIPPPIITRILRYFVHAEFLEEVEGDLEEIYRQRLLQHSAFYARCYYLLDVLHAIRPYRYQRKASKIGHEIFNGIFLRMAFRTLAKRKAYSLLNILALALGTVSFLLIIEYVAFERSYDTFHKNSDRIYRVAFDWGETDAQGRNSSVYASSVPALGPAILQEVPGVKGFTRFVPVLTVKPYCIVNRFQNSKLTYTGHADHGFYADSSFLNIFSFPMRTESPEILSQSHVIVITRSFAAKIYGHDDYEKMVGSLLQIDAQGKEEYIVGGILEDIPPNSHIQFDFLISYATINSERLESNVGWSQFYTYILASHDLSNPEITQALERLLDKMYGIESRISIFLQPLRDIYLTSHLREEVGETGSARQLLFMMLIAYGILFMAWINYINMFLARSMERVSEIGIKKVLGSTRGHLVVQFLTESLLVNVISFVVAFVMFCVVQGPFEQWIGKKMIGVLLNEISLIGIVWTGIFIGSIVAGLYPALILSSNACVTILGTKFRNSRQGIFFKQGLVYFQFIVTFIILASTMIVDRQIKFMQNADLGMELDGCIAIRSPGDLDSAYDERVKLLRERLMNSRFVKSVSFSSSIPGKQIVTSGGVQRVVGPELDGNNVFFIAVDNNFLTTYNIRLIAGKDFSENLGGIPSIILNEAALKTLKFESPVEALKHRVHWQQKEYEIIGVFANYNHLFLKEAFEPMMLSYHPSATEFMTVKIHPGNQAQGIATVKNELQRIFPSAPFEYSFLESVYNNQYYSIQQFESSANFFAVLAIVIAAMGLLALSYYNIQFRSREVAIRKVFGAGVVDILTLLSEKYFRIIVLSCLAGSIITFFIMRDWLRNFAYAIQLNVFDFLLPLATISGIVILTMGYNCVKSSIINPTRALQQT